MINAKTVVPIFAGGGGAQARDAKVTAFSEVNLALKSKSTPVRTSPY